MDGIRHGIGIGDRVSGGVCERFGFRWSGVIAGLYGVCEREVARFI